MPGSQDDSTTVNTPNYLDTDLWEKVTDAQSFRGNWVTPDVRYNIGETVQFFGSLYECNETHKSADNNPGDNGSGFYYWDIVVETPILQV